MSRRQAAARHFLPQTWKPVVETASAFAPVNIALIKYWGKKDEQLHIPVTDSFSVALSVGSRTTIRQSDQKDIVYLNGSSVGETSSFFTRVVEFLDLFRPNPSFYFRIETHNDIPTAAGLASSASGFAALTLALNEFFGWNLTHKKLSCLARLGSGSACRSLFSGFVTWEKGKMHDGSDSFAAPSKIWWPNLQFGLFLLSTDKKPISSREAMQKTVATSPLYASWPRQVEEDLRGIHAAIAQQEIDRFGAIVERNALIMHATMFAASPPICFWLPETLSCLQEIWDARRGGLPIYSTIDAGPNVKLFFPESVADAVRKRFPTLQTIPLLPPGKDLAAHAQ